MTGHCVDEGWMVWVAARATRTDPQRLLDEADVRALVTVVADVERAGSDPRDAAAAALVGIAQRRPFRAGNRATAWMAAAVLLADAGVVLRVSDDAAAGLVTDAERGVISTDDVRRAFSDGPRSRRMSGSGRALSWSCPVCGRELHAYEELTMCSGPFLVSGAEFELTARCWYEHRVHDRSGRPLARRDGDDVRGDGDIWRLVVRDDRSRSVLVLVDHRAVLLRAVAGGYAVSRLADLTIGDLAGSWQRWHDGGEPLGFVPSSSVRFDQAGGMVDWRRLATAVAGGDGATLAAAIPA